MRTNMVLGFMIMTYVSLSPYSVFPVEVSLGSSTHSTAIMVIRKATGTF